MTKRAGASKGVHVRHLIWGENRHLLDTKDRVEPSLHSFDLALDAFIEDEVGQHVNKELHVVDRDQFLFATQPRRDDT